jgi:hypothetical protein
MSKLYCTECYGYLTGSSKGCLHCKDSAPDTKVVVHETRYTRKWFLDGGLIAHIWLSIETELFDAKAGVKGTLYHLGEFADIESATKKVVKYLQEQGVDFDISM